ncbi:MerR family transcriptional regulator [Pradoshia sp. D12]|uniref:MerR family transcriptional regulator n=1 Tax=Bacillaceae TaxID=186817 RepID=UPI0011212FA2|nr:MULTISPECIES: MerR family transcriptional regulator [Bacillaceae]QFK71327.1 MerR family transcriptional regulator [Pradoshia sp. D12]TPF73122.1 MerR family transcriptional regulator [Bacillus sp. D12]
MKGNIEYSIGEFSEKTGIPIRALHYYDEIGLLQPKKNPTSGHRIYRHQDTLTLQKLLSLKFLGYNLVKIAGLLGESSFSDDLNKTLNLHFRALEKEKERIERSMTAVKRVIMILEKEGEVDSTVLFSLIHSTEMDNMQYKWMERHNLSDVAEGIAKKSEEEKLALDQTFIELNKQVKQLYGKPIDHPEVQEVIKMYLEESFAFLGEDLVQNLADADVEELDIQEFEQLAPSPFTENEQKWLNQAIEFYMKHVEME